MNKNTITFHCVKLFLSNFEITMEENSKFFPRVWIRYPDNILTIVDARKWDIKAIWNERNSKSPTIKITLEKEVNTRIPFFNALVIGNNINRIEIDVCRNKTSTNRFIMSDSSHNFQHKSCLCEENLRLGRRIILVSYNFHIKIINKPICSASITFLKRTHFNLGA